MYNVYVTDVLRAIAAGFGASNVPRWYDLTYGRTNNQQEKSAADIVADITNRAGLKVVKKHGSDEPCSEADA